MRAMDFLEQKVRESQRATRPKGSKSIAWCALHYTSSENLLHAIHSRLGRTRYLTPFNTISFGSGAIETLCA